VGNSKRNSAKLDEQGPGRHSCGVKSVFLVIFYAALAGAGGPLGAQDTPPPLAPLPKIGTEGTRPAVSSAAPADVVASAVAAVASLGEQVALGRYEVAVQRMNPAWKERTAKRMGGMEELEKQLGGVAKQMVQQGISIISFKPQGAARSYEVGPGRKVETVAGAEVESLVFSKWLVLVPTATKFRIIREGQTKPTLIDSIGFQVAISDKGKNNWTFIDGSGLTVNDLRGLFATLPQDLQFPPLEKRESR
jgi:hypothetical protein